METKMKMISIAVMILRPSLHTHNKMGVHIVHHSIDNQIDIVNEYNFQIQNRSVLHDASLYM